jgi:hypothetical protein
VEHDLAAQGGLAYWLAYAHPALMLTALSFVLLALRAGFGLRRARRLHVRRDGRLFARHLHYAKLAVLLLPFGFAAGVLSAVGLRGWGALGSAHGWISTGTLALFLATATIGRALERRTAADGPLGARPDLHALLGTLAALCAAASIFTGFVLLP